MWALPSPDWDFEYILIMLFSFVEIFRLFFPNIKFWYGITPIQFEGRVIQILLCCIMELVLFLVPFHHKYSGINTLKKKPVIFVTLCVQVLFVIRDFRGLSPDIWPVRRQNFYYKWYGIDPHCKSLEYNRLAFKILKVAMTFLDQKSPPSTVFTMV